MFKSLMHDMVLAVQTRTGITASFVVWLIVVALAALTAFAFLCVAAYDWLSLQMSSVYAGLVMAAVFVLIAVIGLVVCLLARRRARERAILERAARAHAPSWLLDPKILATAVQVGRSLGWQRVIPLALVGIMVAQWAREHRAQSERAARVGFRSAETRRPRAPTPRAPGGCRPAFVQSARRLNRTSAPRGSSR